MFKISIKKKNNIKQILSTTKADFVLIIRGQQMLAQFTSQIKILLTRHFSTKCIMSTHCSSPVYLALNNIYQKNIPTVPCITCT